MQFRAVALGIAPAMAMLACMPAAQAQEKVSLDAAYDAIHSRTFVDLTHAFAPGIPHYEALPDEQVRPIFDIDKDGFTSQVFTHVGQWGTHVDPPAHFHRGARTVDRIDPRQFVLRMVVLDVHAKVEANPDYVLTMDDVRDWERRHGTIPADAFVAMRTDWSKRWPDAARMDNRDAAGVSHYPGWSMEVLKYLFETRHVTAIGHETTDTASGVSGDLGLERYVLGLDHYQIELLANLDQVPEAGALALVSFPKPQDGTGFPARVVAVLP